MKEEKCNMATRIDDTVRIGDVVSINNKNCLVIDRYTDNFSEERIRVLDGVDPQDHTVIVDNYFISNDHVYVYKTDTHIQVVEDIVNQIKGAKLI